MRDIQPEVMALVLNISRDDRAEIVPVFPVYRPYEHNLNVIAHRVRTDPSIDYWISIDADNPPLRNPIDLAFTDESEGAAIGCPTPMTQGNKVIWNVFDIVDKDGVRSLPGEHRRALGGGKGLCQVDAIGSGCLVIHRSVIDALECPFVREYDRYGRQTKGPDIHFCEAVRLAGLKVWCAWDYPCEHIARSHLLEMIGAK